MNSGPMVSIVIPVYNGGDFLGEAIDSALAQTYVNCEIIVVNDGSCDDGKTEAVAMSYGQKIRYLSKDNGGVASALNAGIREMAGEYFSWLSHDDLYYADKVELQVRAMTSILEQRTILYGDFSVFTSDPAKVSRVSLPEVPPGNFRFFITVSNSINGCTLLIPKAAFAEGGMFNETLRTTQDYDLWFRLSEKYHFVHIPHLLVKSRQHQGQGSITMQSTATRECNALLTGFIDRLSETELKAATHKTTSLAYAEISAAMRSRGFFDAARHAEEMATKNIEGQLTLQGFKTYAALLRGRLQYYPGLLPVFIVWCKNLVRKLFVRNNSLKERFSNIYFNNMFNGRESRSGEGSSMAQTARIRHELPLLIKEFQIRTFLDAPCGDWFWMRETKLEVERYIGVDIVEALIEINRRAYGNSSTDFICRDLAEDLLPEADMIFCRDCLVHLTFRDIWRVIANFKRSGSKYLLTTTFTGRKQNVDLEGKDIWRTLNLELSPFNLPKPLRIINEQCTEMNGQFADKSLALWRLDDLPVFTTLGKTD